MSSGIQSHLGIYSKTGMVNSQWSRIYTDWCTWDCVKPAVLQVLMTVIRCVSIQQDGDTTPNVSTFTAEKRKIWSIFCRVNDTVYFQRHVISSHFHPLLFLYLQQTENSSPNTAVIVMVVIAILLTSAAAGVWLVKKYVCGGRSVHYVTSFHTHSIRTNTQCT